MDPLPKSLESQFIEKVALDSIHPDLALREMLARFPEQTKQLHSLHAAYALGSEAVDAKESATPPPKEFVAAGVARQYEDRGQLGVGGGGEVRLVWDPRLRRELAMKTLPSGMAPGGSAISLARGQRFLNEARLTGSLEHPGVIPVHDMGVDEYDQPFFTMQRVSGRTFTDLTDELHGRIPEPEDSWTLARTIGALMRVCETMAFAHTKGVLHRDLKPDNLMVGPFGEVYVMDWGLAHTPGAPKTGPAEDRDVFAPKGDDVGLTMDGEVLGTPPFMAPEQADGQLGELDQRADVYSLGAVLYHVLVGHAPYRNPGSKSDVHELLKRLRRGKPTDPGVAATDAPEALLAICRKAMSRDRADRYASTKALGKDLRDWSEGRVVGAHRTGISVEILKWVQRNPAIAASLALVGVVALTGIAAFLSLRAKSTRELSKSNYFGTIARISQALENGWTAHVTELMESIEPEHRGWEYGYLDARLRSGMRVETAGVHQGDISHVDLSDDGRFLLSADADGVVALWDTTQQDGESAAKLVRLWRGKDIAEKTTKVTDLELFGDGSAFVVNFGSHAQLFVFDCTSGELRFEAPARAQHWNGLSLSSDSQMIAIGDDKGLVRILNSEDGSLVSGPRTEPGLSSTSELCLLGPGPELTYTGGGLAFYASGQELQPLPSKSSGFTLSLISDRRGERIAALNNRGLVWLWDLKDTKALPYQLSSAQAGVQAITFGPDGDRLALAQGTRLEIWNIDAGQRLNIHEGHGSKVQAVAWSANGSLLASGAKAGELRLWDPSIEMNQSTPIPELVKIYDVDATATRWLMGTSNGFGVYDTATGTVEVLSSDHFTRPLASAWDPDSQARFDINFFSKTLTRTEPGRPTVAVDLTELGSGHDGPAGAEFLIPVPGRPWLLVSNMGSGPCILDKESLRLIQTLEIPTGGRFFQLADDNRTLAYSTTGARYLVDLETGRQIEKTEHNTDDGRFWISPNGSRMAILCDGNRHARMVDRSSGKELFRTIQTGSEMVAGLWSKSGNRLLTADKDGSLYVWDAESGKLALRLSGTSASPRALYMSRDGRRIITVAQGEVAVFLSSEPENQAR